MLRTTNKSVIQQLKIDVLEYFAETAGYERYYDDLRDTFTTIKLVKG